MKRNILYCIAVIALLLLPNTISATNKLPGTPKVWTVPAIFSGDEEVTFYYDVSEIGFAEGVDLYLWAWQPTEPDANHWENSSDFAKLEYVGDGIYKKTMIPTEYFHSLASTFEDVNWAGFWQQLKTKDGAVCCTEYAAPDCRTQYKEFLALGEAIKFYSGKAPAFTDKFTLKDPLSVLVNPDVYKMTDGRTLTEISKDANFVSFNTHSGLNNWDVLQTLDVWRPATMSKTQFKKMSNGIYKWDLTSPYEYYSTNPQDDGSLKPTALSGKDDYDLENMTYLIVTVIKDDKGANQWGVNSGDQLQKAGTAEVYPDPIFSYFPTKVSALDIITLIRQYNEKSAGVLTYSIKTGSKTITGTMDGTRDKRQGTINLIKELTGVTADKLHVTIVTAKNVVVVDTDIPLIPLSEIE